MSAIQFEPITLDACSACGTRRSSGSSEHIGSAAKILDQHHWPIIRLNNDVRASRPVALSAAVITLFCCCSMTKSCPCRQVGMLHEQAKWSQLVVIGYVCCVWSLSLSFRLQCMCRTRSQSWLNGYLCFIWTSILLIGLVISWSSSEGTMRESCQTTVVSRDRYIRLVLSTRFCAVASDLDKSILRAALDFLQWPRSLMVSKLIPTWSRYGLGDRVCFDDISIVKEGRVVLGRFVMDIKNVFVYLIRWLGHIALCTVFEMWIHGRKPARMYVAVHSNPWSDCSQHVSSC